MKLLQMMLSLSLLLLLVPLLAVESSSLTNDNFMSNITRGSSLSSNDTRTPYWLSPSGNIAFGFYKLPCTRSPPNCSDRYIVGIWFVNSPLETLVWKANPNDVPLHRPSSILFTNDGKLMLQIMPENKEKPLLSELQEPASYAKLHDNGNFVLYGSRSQIVWESFDHPTDTLLGGQRLKAGIDLISADHKLSVGQTDGLVAIFRNDASTDSGYRTEKILSDWISDSLSTPVTLNLDTTGNLYLVDSDDVVLKYLFRNKNQQQDEESIANEERVHIYRATLDSGGIFNLYKERIDGNISSSADHNEKNSSSILVLLWQNDQVDYTAVIMCGVVFIVVLLYVGAIVVGTCQDLLGQWKAGKEKRARSAGDLEMERRNNEEERTRTGTGDLEVGKTCIDEERTRNAGAEEERTRRGDLDSTQIYTYCGVE